MTTSANKLSDIISFLSDKYDFDKDTAINYLASKELLPKKLLPKQLSGVSPWASKKAQELAELHNIVPDGDGSGKLNKWTLSDVQKAMTKPTKTKLLISPNALNLANQHNLNITDKVGSGKDGRICIKDVEKWISNDDDEEKSDLNISPHALNEAHNKNITNEQLSTIHGTGKNGRIILEDIHKFLSDDDD